MHIFSREPGFSKPYIVQIITNLGLSNVLHKEIMDALESITIDLNNNVGFGEDILSDTALSFRLLRQHGYNISQGSVIFLVKLKFNFVSNSCFV